MSQSKLEITLIRGLRDKSGEDVSDTVCDGPLDGAIGAKQHCIATTRDGRKYNVEVTTAKVNGDDIEFDFHVDAEPMNTST